MVLPLPIPILVHTTTMHQDVHDALPDALRHAWDDPRVLAFSTRLYAHNAGYAAWTGAPKVYTDTNGAITALTTADNVRALDNPAITTAVFDLIFALDPKGGISALSVDATWRSLVHKTSVEPTDIEVFFTRHGIGVRNIMTSTAMERMLRPMAVLYHRNLQDRNRIDEHARDMLCNTPRVQVGGALLLSPHTTAHGALAQAKNARHLQTLWHHLVLAGHRAPCPFALETQLPE